MQMLTPQQLSALNDAKVMIRMDNEQYLRDHPDVARLMRALVRDFLRYRPANPNTYAYQFFSRDHSLIRRDLEATD
ncbi:Dimerization-anchoring domain of cAMP-dependent protein kinase, regulatory subunit [Plasmopara halstedii]|uniref:Dimerization-anchoring domain of cAMP-dependent protein kinase, regulatory subunit n=1 Tax=Plasmopara halstedii TaxID=4781 RepID=A0A0P1ADQ7_PLAHL|nr:Dimerization-anchoring domain of cAMP-dependent protein kinase, regulatory subunit [Plasmopara halstedii]CEG38645.1 Dimerization-anchoring domain of cAMP-dependent protein kinase, regulatory subunit [Plasmopara halstedii]|eukprot:XP_024575014.1 Dimerization-anchoring domain of cAMP-dependent protein kinase, regulatory subunit [Plasmopara halstedii]